MLYELSYNTYDGEGWLKHHPIAYSCSLEKLMKLVPTPVVNTWQVDKDQRVGVPNHLKTSEEDFNPFYKVKPVLFVE